MPRRSYCLTIPRPTRLSTWPRRRPATIAWSRRESDLSAFNTSENCADYADLRKALKIKRWNVYGLSYGTDLALSLMRDHPEGIRSVIIDAVLPPTAVSLGWTWTNANEAINNIFRACANQPACAASAQFTAQVQKLEASPLTMTVPIPVQIRSDERVICT